MKSQFLCLLLAFLLAASPSALGAPIGLTESDLAQYAQQEARDVLGAGANPNQPFLAGPTFSGPQSAAPLQGRELLGVASTEADFDERDLEDLVDARADHRAMNKAEWADYKGKMLKKLNAHPNQYPRRDVDEDFEERDFDGEFEERDFEDADVDARASGGRAMNKADWADYKGKMLKKLNAHPNNYPKRDLEDDFEERDFEEADFNERDLEDADVDARASGGRAMNKADWADYKGKMLKKLNAHPNKQPNKHHKRDLEDGLEERDFVDADVDERDLADADVDERDFVDFEVEA